MGKALAVGVIGIWASVVIESEWHSPLYRGGAIAHVHVCRRVIISHRLPIVGLKGEVYVGHEFEVGVLAVRGNLHIETALRLKELFDRRVVVECLTGIDEVAELLHLDTIGDFQGVLQRDVDEQLHGLDGVAIHDGADAHALRPGAGERTAGNGDGVTRNTRPSHLAAVT